MQKYAAKTNRINQIYYTYIVFNVELILFKDEIKMFKIRTWTSYSHQFFIYYTNAYVSQK